MRPEGSTSNILSRSLTMRVTVTVTTGEATCTWLAGSKGGELLGVSRLDTDQRSGDAFKCYSFWIFRNVASGRVSVAQSQY